MLSMDEDLLNFKGKMFWVWEGNHTVIAWQRRIDQYYGRKIDWHFNVVCICLGPYGATGVLLDAMNNVNILNFNSYGMYLQIFACCDSCMI